MFDIFGFKARRIAKKEAIERDRQKQLAEKKKAYQARKAKIQAYLDKYTAEQNSKAFKQYKSARENAELLNSRCPKCCSKNIVHHIKRTEGEIHGNGSSYTTSSSSHFLFGSTSSFSNRSTNKIDGKLDTIPINKCNDCGHEWKIAEAKYPSTDNEFSTYSSHHPLHLFYTIKNYLEIKYNPEDITEECNSLEEKQEHYCNSQKNSWSFNLYKTLPKYMLDYALWQGITESSYRKNKLNGNPFWGISDDMDQYSYQMPEELWEICKKVIGWNPSGELVTLN